MIGLGMGLSLGAMRGGVTGGAPPVDPDYIIARQAKEAAIIAAHNATAESSFEGWTDTAGFTTYTETTADGVRSRIEAWRTAPNNLIRIICDWNGIQNLTAASFRGPAAGALTADAGQLGGYVRPSGGVWLQAATGKTPAFGNNNIQVYGMPRFFVEGVGFAGQALAGNADVIRALIITYTGSFPLFALFAAKNCNIGLEYWRPAELPAQYIKGISVSGAHTAHIENCWFGGTRDAIYFGAKYVRSIGNRFTKSISDIHTHFGFNYALWSGQHTYALVEGNLVSDMINLAGFDGLHTDFFQYTSDGDVRSKASILIRNNIAYELAHTSFDSNTQGVFGRHYTGNTTDFDLVVHSNIIANTAYYCISYHDYSGTGCLYADSNLFARAGGTYDTDTYPSIGVTSDLDGTGFGPGSNGGVISVHANYVTRFIDAGAHINSVGGNVFVDPRAGVVSGDGTAEGTAKRPELAYSGTVARDGSDFMTYTIVNANSTDKATAFYAIVDFFEPLDGWGVNAGPVDPETWSRSPARA